MSAEDIVRRVAGAVRNAVVWGVGWFALAFVTILALRTVGVVVPARVSVLDALGMAIKFGVVGGITGGAFSVFISLFYRGQRLSQINWLRFGLVGAVVAGVFVPGFLVVANLLSGDGVPPLDAIRTDIVASALFGGIAAGASMWLAQRGGSRPRLGRDVRVPLASAPPADARRAEGSQAAARVDPGAQR